MKSKLHSEYDVIIVGGGLSGTAAAVNSARRGLKTLLVEQYGFLGGQTISALMLPWDGIPADWQAMSSFFGAELLAGLLKLRGCRKILSVHSRSISFAIDTEILKLALQEKAIEAGVHLLFHSPCVSTVLGKNEIQSVSLYCREGIRNFPAQFFIDATGRRDISLVSGIILPSFGNQVSCRFIAASVAPGDIAPEEISSLSEKWNSAAGQNLDFKISLREGFRKGEVLVDMITLQPGKEPQQDFISSAEITAQKKIQHALDFLRSNAETFRNAKLRQLPAQIGFHSNADTEENFIHDDQKVLTVDEMQSAEIILPGEQPPSLKIEAQYLRSLSLKNLFETGRSLLPRKALFRTNNPWASLETGGLAGKTIGNPVISH